MLIVAGLLAGAITAGAWYAGRNKGQRDYLRSTNEQFLEFLRGQEQSHEEIVLLRQLLAEAVEKSRELKDHNEAQKRVLLELRQEALDLQREAKRLAGAAS